MEPTVAELQKYKQQITDIKIKYMKDELLKSIDQIILWISIFDDENIKPELMQPLLIIEDTLLGCSDKSGLIELSALIGVLREYQAAF